MIAFQEKRNLVVAQALGSALYLAGYLRVEEVQPHQAHLISRLPLSFRLMIIKVSLIMLIKVWNSRCS